MVKKIMFGKDTLNEEYAVKISKNGTDTDLNETDIDELLAEDGFRNSKAFVSVAKPMIEIIISSPISFFIEVSVANTVPKIEKTTIYNFFGLKFTRMETIPAHHNKFKSYYKETKGDIIQYRFFKNESTLVTFNLRVNK